MKSKFQLKPLFFGLVMVFAFSVNAQMIPPKFFDFYHELHYLDKKEKLKLLKKAIKENPNEPWYYVMLADYYKLEKNGKKAVECYEKSIQLDSKFASGYACLATYLYENDSTQLAQALTHINKAILLEPKGWNFHIVRANIYYLMKEYDLAIKNAYMDPIILGGLSQAANEVIVKSLYAQKKEVELTSFIKRADISKGTYNTEFALLLGGLYENMNDFEKACNCYKTVLENRDLKKLEILKEIKNKLKNCKP